MAGTYSGTVVIPVQKGAAYAVNFDGVFIPALLTAPEDGATNERDYRHKAEIRDIGGNVRSKLYGGPYQRAMSTCFILAANLATVRALYPGDTIQMQQVKTDGTLDTAGNWMVEDSPTLVNNREYSMFRVSAILEPEITNPAP